MSLNNLVGIREIEARDGQQFLALCMQLDEESKFMLLEPNERAITVDEQEQRINAIIARRNQVILVAEANGSLVGYIAGLGGNYRRNQHKADVVIGILQAYSGAGLGTRLFEALEIWARELRLHKLELTVMAHNERAIRLYAKMGFEVEGISADSLIVDGGYVDELDMAKFLWYGP
jgi:RimJ/RimL family protein N-acetyltransferase